jgi:hypothetical protein
MMAVLQIVAGTVLTLQTVPMLGAEFDLGPNVTGLLGPLVVAVAALLGTLYSTKQLRPNGGSSIADAIRRIDSRLEAMEDRQLRFDDKLVTIEDKLEVE